MSDPPVCWGLDCFSQDPLAPLFDLIRRSTAKRKKPPLEILLQSWQMTIVFCALQSMSKCGCCVHQIKEFYILGVPIRFDLEFDRFNALRVVNGDGSVDTFTGVT